jgi:hypothetical protein
VIHYQLTVAPEIIACVGEGREPTAQELGRLADRVRREIWGQRPVVAWTPEPRDAATRLASFRIALVGHLANHVSTADLATTHQPVLA